MMTANQSIEPPSRNSLSEPASTTTQRAIAALTEGFRALKIRNYRLFWVGQLISLTGTWMQTTAQFWLALQLADSPLMISLVATLQFLPIMILSPIGGVITDRMSKHRLILMMQVAALAQAIIFGTLVATNLIQLWQLYLLATVLGLINAVDQPARQAFGVELVGREQVVNAVALNSMLFNSARIIGPALAGVFITYFGIAPVIYLNALSFVAVIGGLLLMDTTRFFQTPPTLGGAVRQRLLEGISYVWKTPQVLTILIVVASIGTFGYNFSTLLPLLANFVLHTNAAGFGGLSSFLGMGSLLAALSTAYARRVSMRRLMIGSGCFGILLGGLAISTNFVLSAGLLVALGFAGITFATSANSLLQLKVPDTLRGRVMGLYVLLFAGSTPIGSLLIGSISSVVGVPTALLVCAGLCLLGVIGAALYYHRTEQRAFERAEG